MGDFLAEHWLDILSTVLGLIYIILEYRASIALWFVGIIMPAIDTYLYYSHGLYADFGMAIYYTLAGIYGWVMWRWGNALRGSAREEKAEKPITHFPARRIVPATVGFLVAWGAIWYVLVRWTNSTVPITDSFINALSFVALWALAQKYLEQWVIWILIDAISAVLYAYKGIPFKASLYALYVVIAVLGYMKWKRMMSNQT